VVAEDEKLVAAGALSHSYSAGEAVSAGMPQYLEKNNQAS